MGGFVLIVRSNNKLMQITNDLDNEICNGDCGDVVNANLGLGELTPDVDNDLPSDHLPV